jgi:hypothetical protein
VLPSGVTFSNGTLGGTPATSSAGTYTFSVTATDADGDSATLQGYTLTIQPALAFPAVVTDNETITVTDTETFPDIADSEKITVTDTEIVRAFSAIAVTPSPASFNASSGTGIAGQAYGPVRFTATGGTGALTLSESGTLPSGLTFNNGVLGGTLSASSAGTYTFSVTATDTYGDPAATQQGYTLTISIPTNPQPAISGVSPAFTNAGGTVFTLTVTGSGFIASSTAYWGTSALTTTYVSATQLTTQVPAADIATAGTIAITVQSPAPGGGTSNAWQFEVDTASTGTTGPTITSTTETVAAGSTASYPVTVPSFVTSISVTCLNLPVGATCSYSSTTNSVTITTSPTTPKGTYQIIVVFTETVSGAASGFILLPILLLPLGLMRRKLAARGIWLTACLGLVLMATATLCIGCGWGYSPPPATQQVTSSGSVSLTIQ